MKYLLLFVLSLQSFSALSSDSFRIAVAANFRSTLEALIEQYQAQNPDVTITFSSGSSGSLYQQILHGAPYQLFLSADSRYPEQLEQQHKIASGFRRTYALGELVLWSPQQSLENINSLTPPLTLAIANPKTAPYGRAAREVISTLALKDLKVVQGHSIALAHQFVASGNAEFGLLARSQVLNSENVTAIASDLYQPIEQQMVLLSDKNNAAKKFYHYLIEARAQNIIHEHGYQRAIQEPNLATLRP